MRMTRPIIGWEQQDALTGWRRFYHWQRGQLAAIKRRARRRERREGRQEAEAQRWDGR